MGCDPILGPILGAKLQLRALEQLALPALLLLSVLLELLALLLLAPQVWILALAQPAIEVQAALLRRWE